MATGIYRSNRNLGLDSSSFKLLSLQLWKMTSMRFVRTTLLVGLTAAGHALRQSAEYS
jgi:hypothetical protein